jgi:bifunctional pyridoxal-dependent enzyme with beta-cystathionase and maltose regulon repressor activities
MLMERIGFSSVPGSVFGTSGKGHIIFTVAAPPDMVQEGFNRIFSTEREK